MELQGREVQVGWLLVLVGAVAAVSFAFSLTFDVSFLTVFKPFGGMAVVGLGVGWVLRGISGFNPYDY